MGAQPAAPVPMQPLHVTMGAVALADPDPAPQPPFTQPPVAEAPHAPVRAPQPNAPVPSPNRRPRAASGLFAEPPPEAAAAPAGPSREDVARPSIFLRMTGRLRKQPETAGVPEQHPQQQPQPQVQARRAEPTFQAEPRADQPRAEQPRAAVRPAATDEMGILDIPTFLRRQSS
jgi:hypothetical protein